MENQAHTELLDAIINEHAPKLTNDMHRVYLASIARGCRLMKRYGANGGVDVPSRGPGFDEWIAGNALYANACNKIREAVGDAETDIARRIRQSEGA